MRARGVRNTAARFGTALLAAALLWGHCPALSAHTDAARPGGRQLGTMAAPPNALAPCVGNGTGATTTPTTGPQRTTAAHRTPTAMVVIATFAHDQYGRISSTGEWDSSTTSMPRIPILDIVKALPNQNKMSLWTDIQ